MVELLPPCRVELIPSITAILEVCFYVSAGGNIGQEEMQRAHAGQQALSFVHRCAVGNAAESQVFETGHLANDLIGVCDVHFLLRHVLSSTLGG